MSQWREKGVETGKRHLLFCQGMFSYEAIARGREGKKLVPPTFQTDTLRTGTPPLPPAPHLPWTEETKHAVL